MGEDATLFSHAWAHGGRKFRVEERVFAPDDEIFAPDDDPHARREAARFVLSVDGDAFGALNDASSLDVAERRSIEARLAKDVRDAKRDAPPRASTKPSAAAPAPPSVPPPTSPEVGVVAANGLAARVECSLGPGVLGPSAGVATNSVRRRPRRLIQKGETARNASESSSGGDRSNATPSSARRQTRDAGGEMALANDDRCLRVVVARASVKASSAGVSVGDVLLSLNARALPPKLDAGELMALLRGNPRYMLSPVDACLWRPRVAAANGASAAPRGRETSVGSYSPGRTRRRRAVLAAAGPYSPPSTERLPQVRGRGVPGERRGRRVAARRRLVRRAAGPAGLLRGDGRAGGRGRDGS